MKKRIKILFISVTALILSGLFIQAGDDYFEISKNLDIFASLYREINSNYVDETKPGKLMKVGIDAMLVSLDPYTNFIPESQIEDFRFMTTGQYGGIGALIQKRDEFIIITETYDGFPAQKEDVMIGDRILEIDGKSVVGKTTTEISEFLKGQPASAVNIKLERGLDGQTKILEKKIERAEITILNVPYYDVLQNKTGYIKLNGFTQTASDEFGKAFRELKEKNQISSLIIDLRGNGGGLLKESVNIVNFFVERGTEVVSTRGKLKEWDQVYLAINNPIDLNIPIVVLVDENSASASEIVAGSLQDLDRAIVVGKETFGKGLVQQTVDLSYNSKLKVTVAKYYIPSGRCIQRLDYSERNENGDVHEVPDSLIREFKSLKYKRPLFDGKGIKPDVELQEMILSNISMGLLQDYHIFDYATNYRLKNDKIGEVSEYMVSDDVMSEFKTFVDGKQFEYSTNAEKLLAELKKSTQDEKYYESVEKEYNLLSQKLTEVKNQDFDKHQQEIKQLLSSELTLRYYHQRGQLIHSLKHDGFITEALAILQDKGRYESIITGKLNTTK